MCFVLLMIGVCFTKPLYGQTSAIGVLQHQLSATRDSNTYVTILNKIGFLMHMKSADSCFYYGVKAKAIADRLNFSPGRADALANIAIALTLKGLYSQSLTYYSKSLAEYKKCGNNSEVAQMLMNSAITYSFIGDSTKSLQFAKSAVNEAAKNGPDSLVSMLYANYDNLNHSLSADSSRYYLQKAKGIANKYKDVRVLLFLEQLKADKLLSKGQNDQALPYILHSLSIARSQNWEYHELESLDMYARYNLAKNQVDSAAKQYTSIYNTAITNGFVYWKTEVLKSLLHCYELKHDDRQQERINKLLVSSMQQNNNNNNTFIGDYIAYNNTQQQLSELKILNSSNRIKIWFLIVLSTIGAAFTILVSRMYNRSRKGARMLLALNEKIGDQNRELQLTDEFKGRLISMLAHDFRAPMVSIISLIHLLKEDDHLDKEQLTGMYDSIQTDVQNTLITFDNILQWVKKQLSGYVFNPKALSVCDLMNDASSMFKANMNQKQVVFKNNVPQSLTFYSDKEIVQFINRNLIHNAIKFSLPGGVVTVDAAILNDEVVVTVKDEGIGISESRLKKLFAFNNDKKTESSDQGAGIALTICKEFIKKINGRLWAESKEKNGTIFFYALPLKIQS